ncbi:MAG: leucine-rich repeat protein [Clostridia bacterium]|nr:leucine-rich repeat protein [Clostridia bacterium]
MKKKILLAIAMVTLLVCVFAISVSAAEPAYNDGEWIYAADGTTKLAIRDTEGNPLVWYMNGEELKYVRADQTDETQSVYIKYTISAGGSGFDKNVFSPQKTLKEMTIVDNGTSIKIHGVKDSAIVLFNMEKLDIDAINGWFFGNKNGCCTSLRGIVFPNSLQGIGQEGFANTKLVQIWNLENTGLFYLNASNFAATSTLTQEATDYVFKCPQTVDAAPINVQGAQIKTYVMSPVSTFNTCQKWYQTWRNCKQLEKIFVPAHFAIGFGEEAFRDTPNQYIVFFTGTEEQAISMRDNTQDYCNNGFKSSQVISYETYLADQSTYDNSTKQAYIVYGYNYCDAFFDGEHTENDNTCVINCDRCDDYDGQMKKNPQHKYVNVIAYENYLENGTKTQTCQNDGCIHKTTPNVVAVEPIIASFKGFSVNYDGDAITFGYVFNDDAIKEFEEVNGTTVEFGFVAGVKALLGDKMPLDEGAANVVKAVVDNKEYSAADFILRGNWDRNVTINEEEVDIKDVEFYMAGYILVGDTVAYLNANGSSMSAGVITFATCDVPEAVE